MIQHTISKVVQSGSDFVSISGYEQQARPVYVCMYVYIYIYIYIYMYICIRIISNT